MQVNAPRAAKSAAMQTAYCITYKRIDNTRPTKNQLLKLEWKKKRKEEEEEEEKQRMVCISGD